MIEYELIRSRRRSIALSVNAAGQIIVRAPNHATLAKIEQFIESKQSWLEQQSLQRQQEATVRQSHTIKYGDWVDYLGSPVQILPSPRKIDYVEGDVFYLRDGVRPQNTNGVRPQIANGAENADNGVRPQLKTQLIKLYKQLARAYYSERMAYWSALMGCIPQQMRLSSARTRWGSCSNKGTISLTWFMIMADKPVIDYVIIHELAHLRHPNHSQNFWEFVERFCPDYKRRRLDLRGLQKQLACENWS